ncbi:MAG: hypothetical protein HY923_08805 [Elusimicrobia bacterium]|nr:hypothetical protein [Elusimicrobiota bacterium]
MCQPLLALALAAALAAPSVASETILVVGDSHTVGAFGAHIDEALRAVRGNRVATYGVCSSRPQSYLSESAHGCGHVFRDFDKKPPSKWLGSRVYKELRKVKGVDKEVEMVKTPELGQLLTDHTPSTVIVALGSNIPINGASVAKTLALIHKAGAACLWVGPPDMRRPTKDEVDAVYATLAKNKVDASVTMEAAKKDGCRLIDSREFSYLRYPEKDGDGTHYMGKLTPLAAKWGDDAAAAALKALTP